MPRSKADGRGKPVPNKHILTRISFLFQAAQYLANLQSTTLSELETPTSRIKSQETEMQSERTLLPRRIQNSEHSSENKNDEHIDDPESRDLTSQHTRNNSGLPRELASQILTISRRSVAKGSREIKRSICKRCTSVLMPGQTAEHRMENQSRGGRKPWADILVVTCLACGMEKRYPVGAPRQAKKKHRKFEAQAEPSLLTS